jgi:hypothetical protein
MLSRRRLCLSAALATGLIGTARAQDAGQWPNRVVRLIVP